jgi:hypothetical protein
MFAWLEPFPGVTHLAIELTPATGVEGKRNDCHYEYFDIIFKRSVVWMVHQAMWFVRGFEKNGKKAKVEIERDEEIREDTAYKHDFLLMSSEQDRARTNCWRDVNLSSLALESTGEMEVEVLMQCCPLQPSAR